MNILTACFFCLRFRKAFCLSAFACFALSRFPDEEAACKLLTFPTSPPVTAVPPLATALRNLPTLLLLVARRQSNTAVTKHSFVIL